MADILIRGMEMPESCADCPICYDMMECSVSPLRFWNGRTELEQFVFCNERHPSCPLVELPEHGDLIDCRAALANCEEPTIFDLTDVPDFLREQPVIVPASEGGADG